MYFTNFTKNFIIRKIGSDDMQAFLSILKASKQDDDESQRLICAKDKGGLWKLNSDGQKIF